MKRVESELRVGCHLIVITSFAQAWLKIVYRNQEYLILTIIKV